MALSLAQWILGGGTLVVWALMLWRGRTPDRVGIGILIALSVISPFVPAGHVSLALSVSATLALILCALAWPRWWLIGVAGVQLATVASHLAWIGLDTTAVWAAVTLRLTLWVFAMIFILFGVWEARAAPYASPKTLLRDTP